MRVNVITTALQPPEPLNKVMKSLVIIEKIREKLKESDQGKRTVTCVIQFNFSTIHGETKTFGNYKRYCFQEV